MALRCDGCGGDIGEDDPVLIEELHDELWQYTHDIPECVASAERMRSEAPRTRGAGRRGPAPIDYRTLLGGSGVRDDEGSTG